MKKLIVPIVLLVILGVNSVSAQDQPVNPSLIAQCPTSLVFTGSWYETSSPWSADVDTIYLRAVFQNADPEQQDLEFGVDGVDTFDLSTLPCDTEVCPAPPFTIVAEPSGVVPLGGTFAYDLVVDVSGLPADVTGLAFAPIAYPYWWLSPDVAPMVQNSISCTAPVPPPQPEEVIYEEEIVFGAEGETISVTIILEQAYPYVSFRTTWPGSSYDSKLIYEGTELTEQDENVDHQTSPTSDEWIVTDAQPGEYVVQVTAVNISSLGETVTVGAYVVAGPITPGRRGSLRGTAFEDTNGNGLRDGGEAGLPGVEVTVSSAGDWSQVFTTGDDGSYAPVGLGASNYSVEVTVPEGYAASGPTRYEGIGIGIVGYLALGLDFALRPTTLPAALPATGAGPGSGGAVLLYLATAALAGVGLFFILRGTAGKVTG